MQKDRATETPSTGDDELAALAEGRQSGILREFLDFLLQNKKWWLAPVIIVLLLVGLLVILGGTAAAPFIYTLF